MDENKFHKYTDEQLLNWEDALSKREQLGDNVIHLRKKLLWELQRRKLL